MDKDDNSPATLGLKNMMGVFILVGVGIIGGLGLIVIEIAYKKHQIRNQSRTKVARKAASKWRGVTEVRSLVQGQIWPLFKDDEMQMFALAKAAAPAPTSDCLN